MTQKVQCTYDLYKSHMPAVHNNTLVLSFVIVSVERLDWSVCTCLTRLCLMVEICIEFTTLSTTEYFGA